MLTLGVQAETRIVPAETKPEVPVPGGRRPAAAGPSTGRINLAVPIDVPFTE